MKVVTAREMQNIDKISINQIGIPGEVLMGYAGKSIAEYIYNNIRASGKIAIFSGTGNNGGDGFVVGYFLCNKGIDVDIYIAGDKERVSEVSGIYLKICINSEIPIFEIKETVDIDGLRLVEYDLIVDSLLGTGFKGAVRGISKYIIKKINGCGIEILSVDIPSGLPSNGEAPEGELICADYTVTIGLPKISLVTYPGKGFTGELYISDIGFPSTLTNSNNLNVDLVDDFYVRDRINFNRDIDSHKGMIGHLLLVGGFDNMEGAIIMTAKSALETGVGLVTLLTTEKARSIIAGIIPELITDSLNCPEISEFLQTDSDWDGKEGIVTGDISNKIENKINNFFNNGRQYDVMVIGPGMGRSVSSSLVFNIIFDNLIAYGIKRVLIDGDGLYNLAEYLKDKELPHGVDYIITPHFIEASRLLKKSVDEIKRDRLNSAIRLSKGTSTTCLLKGPATIVSNGKETLINSTGNPSMAIAGSGDVLSGIIGALLHKNISSLDAAGIGSFFHGMAADIYVKENDTSLMKATNIINYIRKAISYTLSNEI